MPIYSPGVKPRDMHEHLHSSIGIGPKGDDGERGEQGEPGFSPTVSTGDHVITITDVNGPHVYELPTYADEEAARAAAETARQEAEQARQAAETVRQSKESTRVSFENQRKSNENTRKSNERDREFYETARQNNESSRVSKEISRQINERDRRQAEQARVDAEQQRVTADEARNQAEAQRASDWEQIKTEVDARGTAEAARQQAEQDRASNEIARQQAEAARNSAEQARRQAESSRDSAEQVRMQHEQDRSRAENARNIAESARSNAEDARVSAEQGRAEEWLSLKSDAIQATNDASSAATSANTAATNANATASSISAATARGDFDGYSPTVAITDTELNHTITITDRQGPHAYTVPTYADEEQARQDAWDQLSQDAQEAIDAATEAAEGIAEAYFPGLAAGSADGITGGGPLVEGAFVERACPGSDGPAYIKSIKGRTLAWNQLIGNKTPTGTASLTSIVTKTGDSYVFNGTASTAGNYYFGRNVHVVAGHKYLIGNIAEWSVDAGPNSGQAYLMLYDKDNTAIIGRTNAVGATIATAAATVDNADFYINVNKADVTLDVTIYPQLFDLTAMFGAGNEPATVAEFEALYPESYYPYDAGSLLPVNMTGMESVGFNQWDEQWEVGGYSGKDGTVWNITDRIRSKADRYIRILPDTTYYSKCSAKMGYFFYDAAKGYISYTAVASNHTFATPANASYMRFFVYSGYGTTYNHDICINLSGPRNGEYEAHWSEQRTIAAIAENFPNGMRSAGSAYDELTEHEAIHRVGEAVIDGNTPIWVSASAGTYTRFATGTIPNAGGEIKADRATYAPNLQTLDTIPNGISSGGISNRIYFTLTANETTAELARQYLAEHPITIHYPLDTPTTTPINPPLNLTYRAEVGGTERVMHEELTAPPTLVVQYGSTADGIRDRAVSMLAAADGPTATANHAIGSYLTMGGTLYKVTTAIASGEAIVPGTNVTETTVMAEVLSLIQ